MDVTRSLASSQVGFGNLLLHTRLLVPKKFENIDDGKFQKAIQNFVKYSEMQIDVETKR